MNAFNHVLYPIQNIILCNYRIGTKGLQRPAAADRSPTPECQEIFAMTTENRLSIATENRRDYETIMRQARAERAEALRALLFSIGRGFGHLSAAIGFARRQSRGLAGARF